MRITDIHSDVRLIETRQKTYEAAFGNPIHSTQAAYRKYLFIFQKLKCNPISGETVPLRTAQLQYNFDFCDSNTRQLALILVEHRTLPTPGAPVSPTVPPTCGKGTARWVHTVHSIYTVHCTLHTVHIDQTSFRKKGTVVVFGLTK
jgi:hypothetical protein